MQNFAISNQRCRKGVSLLEAVISTVMIGAVAVTSLSTMQAIFRAQQQQDYRLQAQSLIDSYLAEVVQANYQESSIPVAINLPREQLKDVDDFHNRTEMPLQHRNGAQRTDLSPGWKVQIVVTTLDPTANTAVSVADLGLKKITVTITDPLGNATSASTFRSKWGVNENKSSGSKNYVEWVGLNLRKQGRDAYFSAGGKALERVETEIVDPNPPPVSVDETHVTGVSHAQ